MRLRNGQSGQAFGEARSRPTRFPHAARASHHSSRFTPAFTLIELILVMALLTIVISLTAPSLSRFFHGRTLDSEARRLLALTRSGQSRAVSEGVPMDLWIDAQKGEIGLEAEPSYESNDTKAIEFTIDNRLKIEVQNKTAATPVVPLTRSTVAAIASAPQAKLVHADLPTIRFLPDGTLGDASPQKIQLTGADSGSLWLVQSRDGRSYEIRSTDK
jgi:prepilin-type N-terminal cleavage/methylation domain-containing protein